VAFSANGNALGSVALEPSPASRWQDAELVTDVAVARVELRLRGSAGTAAGALALHEVELLVAD